MALPVSTAAFEYERIDKDNAVLLVVDHQIGLYQMTRDFNSVEYRNNILAHAELGKIFNLPTILTSSTPQGPNGPLPQEIFDLHPEAPYIARGGEVNAWDNEDFRNAVKATGKQQVILAGIVTDVCTAFLALSLRAEGYSVFANSEASGTTDLRLAADANDRMRAAGVHILSNFAIACELMRDWRNTPGAVEMLPYFDKYLPIYGQLTRGHHAAITNGTILPGEVA
ncbi:ycaC protein [Cylindrobasidium torrendii FP15055 ss-10]|uniref:YcaC protein n=1 Tax=Cylindrobasidium torrendii FP15055 ss-10 TaxID=1314674 RepID=A0A0D7B5W7_9AGAR|nr:ycaC protein [Cylindrobasidium torrendii FP15055 ss-10]